VTTPNGYGSCSISPRPVDELNRLYSWGHRKAPGLSNHGKGRGKSLEKPDAKPLIQCAP